VAATCVDNGLRWSQAINVWYNAQVRTLLQEPLFILTKLFGKRDDKEARPA